MRYLVLSDIHANLEAIETVLDHAEGAWDRSLVLGDLVGYGADPAAVIARVRALEPAAIIRGNHDKVACGLDDAREFNNVARIAAAWTAAQLSTEDREYLRALPQGPADIDDRVEICHGAPFDEDHYIFDAGDARRALAAASRALCLFGHTHLPVVFRRVDDAFSGGTPNPDAETVVKLQRGVRYLINPGSVGQPRDGDARAAYAILDDEAQELTMIRVRYPVEDAQAKILSAGLPPSLANRLALGR
ncbi:MAG TPA: metallophosphoesterase family protein [Vicinamibacterales bacterium]|nr:metallophosphoesterase family protein [Vicinamibacterales bacterium]